MRVRVSQQAPRLPGARFLAGCRIWASPFRRIFPYLALAFLLFLPALVFEGSHFAQLSLNRVLGPVEPPAAGAGHATAPGRHASLHATTSSYDRPPRKQLQSKRTAESLPVQAGGRDDGTDEAISARVNDGPGGMEVTLRAKLQGLEVRRPRVSRIEISSDPGTDEIYAAEEEIQVTVTFSRPVQVTGSPEIELRMGTKVTQAIYQSGSGSSELVFAYQVAAGDEDADGVSVEVGSLRLDDGEISDLSGIAVFSDHAGLEADPGHRVDGVRPALLEEEAEINGEQLILPFAESLDVASTPEADDFRVTVAGESREVLEVAVEGSEVRLTLLSPAKEGQAAAVSYEAEAEPAGKVVRDRAGNPAEEFTELAVVNRSGDALPARAVRQIQAILEAKQRRTPAQKKMDSQLLEKWQKRRASRKRTGW